MQVGIVGLGLIGGSFAKAYSKQAHTVYAFDTDKSTLDFAVLSGAVHKELTQKDLKNCDLILLCVYPKAAVKYVKEHAADFGKKPIVMDACGTKREVATPCMKLAEKNGFTYVGGHPMAGTQYSGFKYAKDNLYKGQPMVIVPPVFDDIELLAKIKKLLAPAGFGSFSVTTADKHDEMIAFTSQLAHIVSSAYIKSPTALSHKGFSAGSYKDMTRVAWLNPQMWAELFLENGDFLGKEIDTIIGNLTAYKEAIEEKDKKKLEQLLQEGKERKEEVDG